MLSPRRNRLPARLSRLCVGVCGSWCVCVLAHALVCELVCGWLWACVVVCALVCVCRCVCFRVCVCCWYVCIQECVLVCVCWHVFCIFVVVLHHSNSISVISWHSYDVWDEKEKPRAYTVTNSWDLFVVILHASNTKSHISMGNNLWLSTHGDSIVLPHWKTRPPTPWSDIPLSHIILTLIQPVPVLY